MASRLFGHADAGLGDAAGQMIEFLRLSHLADEQAGSELRSANCSMLRWPSWPGRACLLDEPAGGVNLTMLGHLRERLHAYHAERRATFVVIERQMESSWHSAHACSCWRKDDHRRGYAAGHPA